MSRLQRSNCRGLFSVCLWKHFKSAPIPNRTLVNSQQVTTIKASVVKETKLPNIAVKPGNVLA